MMKLLLACLCLFFANGFSFQLLGQKDAVAQIINGYKGIAITKDSKGNGIIRITLPDLAVDTLITAANGFYHPRISPDGKYLVYGDLPQHIILLNLETKQIKDLGLGSNPTWWVDPADAKTYMVYADRNTSVVTDAYPGETYKQLFEDGALKGEKTVLLNQAYKAGLSRDGRWLGTADKTPFLCDLQHPQKETYKLTIGSSTCFQRMNPTTDPNRMDQIVYILDKHQLLVTKNHKDSIVWSMDFATLPEFDTLFSVNNNKWSHNAWSNIEDLMLTGVLHKGISKIVILRRSDKKIVSLAEAGPHQDMWLEKTAGVSLINPGYFKKVKSIQSLNSPGSSHFLQGNVKYFDMQGKITGTLSAAPGPNPHGGALIFQVQDADGQTRTGKAILVP